MQAAQHTKGQLMDQNFQGMVEALGHQPSEIDYKTYTKYL